MFKKTQISMRYFSLLFIFYFLFSCNKLTEWSDKERQDFKIKCTDTKFFTPGPISFKGFEFEEIDTIKIVEKYNATIVDTFFIYTEKDNHMNRIENKEYWTDIEKELNINHNYEFYLGKDKPYILDDMQMIMWRQNTMKGEGWGCEMGNFTIDNEKFEHVGNINFRKRGFKEKWE